MNFSLQSMLTGLAYFALVCAFFVTNNTVWSQIVFLMTLALVMFATISAVLGPVATRVYRGCFACAAGSYLALAVLSPATNDYFLVGSLFARLMKTLDEVPQFHSGMMSQIRQNRDFTLNLAVGTKTIGNCAFALVFGLVAARFGERLDRRRRRDEMKPDAP